MSIEQPKFTITATKDGYEMMVEVEPSSPLFITDDGKSHRVVLTGPRGGVLSSVYTAAMNVLQFYKPERET